MDRFRLFTLTCVILLFGIIALIFITNVKFLQVTQFPSSCAKLKFRRSTSPKSQFFLAREENFFTAKCEANYPVEMIVDSGKIDKETLFNFWIQQQPCGLKEGKTFTSQYSKSYEPNDKFTMGLICAPQCGGIECAERVRLEHSGDNFITLENKAIVWSTTTRDYAESGVVSSEIFTREQAGFKFLMWNGFIAGTIAASYISICLATIYFIREI